MNQNPIDSSPRTPMELGPDSHFYGLGVRSGTDWNSRSRFGPTDILVNIACPGVDRKEEDRCRTLDPEHLVECQPPRIESYGGYVSARGALPPCHDVRGAVILA